MTIFVIQTPEPLLSFIALFFNCVYFETLSSVDQVRASNQSDRNDSPGELFFVGVGDLRAVISRARREPIVTERNVIAVELDLTLVAPRRVLVADEAVLFFVPELGAAR